MLRPTLTQVDVVTPLGVKLSVATMMLGAVALLAGLVAGFGLPSTTTTTTSEPVASGRLAAILENDPSITTPYVPDHLLVKMKSGSNLDQIITDVLAEPVPQLPNQKVEAPAVDLTALDINASDPTAVTTTVTDTSVVAQPVPLSVVSKTPVLTPASSTQPTSGASKPDSSTQGTLYDLKFSGDGFDPLAYAAAFSTKTGVEYAEPDYYVKLMQLVPNDPYFASSGAWGQAYNDSWGLGKIGITAEGQNSAWDIQKGSSTQAIADIDTGVDYTHEDLRDRIWINAGEDTNKNGKVDGELFSDVGVDGKNDRQEPGWDAQSNSDPSKDNYNATTNVFGTEGNYRYDLKEPFADCGLDGICPGDARYVAPDADKTEGNSTYNAGDFDFIDNDSNGYIDDIRGWDFGGSKTIPSYDNDPIDTYGHGTHIAGTIGAATSNGIGMAGINRNVKIMIIKGFQDHSSAATVSRLGLAVRYAADNGARVANASWGMQTDSKFLRESVTYAYSKNMVTVAAAGNDGSDMSGYSPAKYPEVITVSASDPNDQPTYFTNYGGKIDVAAPGGGSGRDRSSVYNILSSLAKNSDFANNPALASYRVGSKYIRVAGTSMAAPHVAGVASLLTAQNSDWSVEQIRQALRSSADDVYTSGWDPYAGYGRINARKALQVQESIGVKILSPIQGASFTDRDQPFAVNGTVQGTGITKYTLYLGQGATPSSWTTLKTASTPGVDIPLFENFKPSDLAFGKYTLRLVVETLSGRVYEDRMNFSKFLPYHGNWPVDTKSKFLVGTPLVADIDESSDKKLEIFFQGYSEDDFGTTYIYREDGTPLPGWPKVTNAFPSLDAAIGDVFPTVPGKEITVRARFIGGHHINLYNSTGDEIVQNWPKKIDDIGTKEVQKMFDNNNDGAQEIITRVAAGYQSWKGSGEQSTALISDAYSKYSVIGNFNTDSKAEILSGSGNMYSFNASKSSLPLSKLDAGVAADVNGDGMLEAVVVLADQLHVFNGSGVELDGNWPVHLKNFIPVDFHWMRTPSVGDINGDGKPEIVVATPDVVYAFDAKGNAVPGWPVSIESAEATPVIGDVDGDGKNDVVFGTFSGSIHAVNGSGKEIDGWPMALNVKLYNSVALKDIDGNGKNELIVASAMMDGIGRVHVFDTPGTTVAWPMRAFDERNTGAASIALPTDKAEIVGAFNAVPPFSESPAQLLMDYKIPVTVGNIGGKGAINIQLQLYDGQRELGGKQIGTTIVIPTIEASKQETREFVINFKLLEDQGVHSIYFYYDAANTVPEMYENNVAKRSVYVHDMQLSKTEELFSSAYNTVSTSGKYIVAGYTNSLSKIELRDTDLKTTLTLTSNGWNPKVQGNWVVWGDNVHVYLYNISTKAIEIIAKSNTRRIAMGENYVAWIQFNQVNYASLYLYDIHLKKTTIVSAVAYEYVAPVLSNNYIFFQSATKTSTQLESYNIQTQTTTSLPTRFSWLVNGQLHLIGDHLISVNSNYDTSSKQLFVYSALHLPTGTVSTHPISYFKPSLGYGYLPLDTSRMYYSTSTTTIGNHDVYNAETYLKIPKAMLRDGTIDPSFVYLGAYGTNGAILTALGKTILAENRRPNHPPSLNPISDKTTYIGSTLSFQVQARDLESDAITYTSPNLPTGATLNTETGAFTWVPKIIIVDDVKGDVPYLVTFKATDSKGASGEVTVKITVTPTPTCFGAGTQITRADGTATPIEQLQMGDAVMAYDEMSGQLKPARVTQMFTHKASDYLRVNGTLVVTPNHPMLVKGKWVEADFLKVGDTLTTATGNKQRITSIEKQHGSIPVYNLEVSPFHTYVADGFVVHNKLAPPTAPMPVNEGLL